LTIPVVENLRGFAFEAAPKYEPQKWNDNEAISISTNCYCYMLNIQHEPFSGKLLDPRYSLQPGYISGSGSFFMTRDELMDLIELDGFDVLVDLCKADAKKLGLVMNQISPKESIPTGYYRVALFVDSEGKDYHCYRENPDHYTWSHKIGDDEVIDFDASGEKITDPCFADRDYGEYDYSILLGFFSIGSQVYNN